MVTMGIALAPVAESMPAVRAASRSHAAPHAVGVRPGELVRFISGGIEEMGPKAFKRWTPSAGSSACRRWLPASPHEGSAQTSTAAAPDDLGQLATAEAPAVEEPKSRAAFGAIKPKGKAEDGGAHVALESGTGAKCRVSSRRDPGNTA
jgi:hypothetical protein